MSTTYYGKIENGVAVPWGSDDPYIVKIENGAVSYLHKNGRTSGSDFSEKTIKKWYCKFPRNPFASKRAHYIYYGCVYRGTVEPFTGGQHGKYVFRFREGDKRPSFLYENGTVVTQTGWSVHGVRRAAWYGKMRGNPFAIKPKAPAKTQLSDGSIDWAAGVYLKRRAISLKEAEEFLDGYSGSQAVKIVARALTRP